MNQASRLKGCLLYAWSAALLLTAALPSSAQIKPTAPGTPGDPLWTRALHLSDGRTFVTDGGLAIDAAVAKPATLPSVVLSERSATLIEQYLAAPLKDEVYVTALTPNPNGRTFAAPSGLLLNATYVKFLKRILPARSLRIRMETEQQPMVVVSDGKPVGVLMAVKR
jgi:hypothetical protein